MIIIVDI